MTTNEQIDCLLGEAAELCDIESVLRVRGNEWAFVLSADLLIEIEFDAVRKCLSLNAALGRPEQARRLEIYEQLLVFASLGRQTGGLRVALDEPGGCLWLILDLFIDEPDAAEFVAVFDLFVEKVVSRTRPPTPAL